MLTLIGDSTISLPNPKLGNLETVDKGLAINTTRLGVTSQALVALPIEKRRFDFQWLTLSEKDTFKAFLIAHIGRSVTIQWTSGDSCNTTVINGPYIVDDQPIEIITIHDGCSYDIATYWIKIPTWTPIRNRRVTEAGSPRITESGATRILDTP